MSCSKNKFTILFDCEEVVYGALLKENTTYKALVEYARKKFGINHTFDISLHYEMGSNLIRIDDDNDVEVFSNGVYNSIASTPHKLFVQKVKLSSSKNSGFDLNVSYCHETPGSIECKKKKNKQKRDDEIRPFKWVKNNLSCVPEPPEPPTLLLNTKKYEFPNGKTSRILKKGDDFDNKVHCMCVIGKKALDENFEFKVRKSNKTRFDVICKNKECKWKIISSKSKTADTWLLGTVNDIHTCSRTQLNPNHRNATIKLLGWLLAPKLKDYSRKYTPKDIIHDINHEYNIDITYKKAWGGKNKALEMNSGDPLESFSQLPYYFYNLKLANEGTVTHIETDDEGRFKMCFVAFGVTIRSFKTHMRPLLITDGAHLKGTYKGTNLVLCAMDGNNQIIPIATGVSQGETAESWTWFLLKFKECIGEIPNLAIISDRHPAIILACNLIFPDAFHGYCGRHLLMNCKITSDKLQAIYWKTVKAYTQEEFEEGIDELRSHRPAVYDKLQMAGFETWSRALCPADRYNYMTSNSAESINNLSRHYRKAPITNLMEWYRALLQKWYCARRKKYQDSEGDTLSDFATHKVMYRMQKSVHWRVLGIEYGKLYQVDDLRKVHKVNLTERTCTCRRWQISGIPCGHVIAVSRNMGCSDCSHLVLEWFRNTTLYSTYQELVYPVGEPSSWVIPDGLQIVKPPNINFRPAGRPKNTDRIRSQGEIPIPTKCSRCGVRGHNRSACHQPIANFQVYSKIICFKTYNEKRVRRSSQTEQQAPEAYANNYVRSQEYAEDYNFNYEANYSINHVNPQEHRSAYDTVIGSSQGYEAAYYNFNHMFGDPNINFGGQPHNPEQTMPFITSDFNLGQSSQQTYSTWGSSWAPLNLGEL